MPSLGRLNGEFIAIYQVECSICGATPVVGIRTPSGQLASTGFCGSHFFGDRGFLDPEEWTRQKEDTE